jgi:hypothetical protein
MINKDKLELTLIIYSSTGQTTLEWQTLKLTLIVKLGLIAMI